MARNVKFPEGEIEVSEEFSNRDFTGDNKTISIPDGAVVYGSCFSRETPGATVFDPTMTGVTFRNCNLSNVFVPPGNTVIDCQVTRYKVQSDKEDWVVDDKDAPVEPLDKDRFIRLGKSLSPDSLPAKDAQ